MHSEQGPCTLRDSKMLLTYGVGTCLQYLSSSASLCKNHRKVAGMCSMLKGETLSLQARSVQVYCLKSRAVTVHLMSTRPHSRRSSKSQAVLFQRLIAKASCARQFVTYGVDKQHALHDVPEAGAAGIWQGVIHSLHYCLEEATLVLCLEGQLSLYSRQDSSRNANHADRGVIEPGW